MAGNEGQNALLSAWEYFLSFCRDFTSDIYVTVIGLARYTQRTRQR